MTESHPIGTGERLKMLEDAVSEAIELLLERKQGSPARSAGHNARLVLQRALSTLRKDEAE